MNPIPRILYLSDTPGFEISIVNELKSELFDCCNEIVNSQDDFIKAINNFDPALVITDFVYKNFDGIKAITEGKTNFPQVDFIVLTSKISELEAVDCIKAGASNIVIIDQLSSLNFTIQEAIQFQRARREKRHIEEQLAREREVLSISLASIGEAIISVDLTGNVILFNQAAAKITGFEIEQAVEHPVTDVLIILDEKTNTILNDPITYLLELEEKNTNNIPTKRPVLIRKDCEKILIAGKITPILVDHTQLVGYIIVFDDVTQKEMSAAQSILSIKMESIGQLAAGIAHEINTPIQYLGDNLNFINRSFQTIRENDQQQLAFLQNITQEQPAQLNANDFMMFRETHKIEHLLTEIPIAISESLEGVERVRKIVMAIREFSHPSQKVNTLSDINKGILTTVTISKNEWKYCSTLETNLDPDLPLVWCKIDEINQVLLNMIVNATHAIQEKQKTVDKNIGKITITTSRIEDRIIISISDTGCGIPENLISRIFDPFFTTKEVGKGTGQGLSLAHNIIVNHHHGQIRVESHIGVGTTFTIEIPIAHSESEENRDQ